MSNLTHKPVRVLYITWDGPQVQYLQGLFGPILSRLSAFGIEVEILQFTWADKQTIDAIRTNCEQIGLKYHSIRVERSSVLLGTAWALCKGYQKARQLLIHKKIDVVLARSVLPAWIALHALNGSHAKLVFDADGLPLDERVEHAEKSATDLLHRMLRDVESQALFKANAVLTRTHRSVPILQARAGAGSASDKYHVVGNGRDPELFQPASFEQKLRVRQSLGIDVNSPLAVYAGSMGAQYCLEHMLRFMTHALRARPDAKLLCLTGQPDVVRSALAQHPILQNCVCMLTASAHEMPELIGCADLGLAFRTPSFSMKAVSPIKIGEYLLCGLPVLAGHDIGDTDDLASDVFRPIDSSNDQALEYAALWWLQDIHPRHEAIALQARCSGLKHFSLDATVKTYATTILQVTKKHIH